MYDAIIKLFAGPADKGLFSPSVQNTLYLIEKLALDSVPEVCLKFTYFLNETVENVFHDVLDILH